MPPSRKSTSPAPSRPASNGRPSKSPSRSARKAATAAAAPSAEPVAEVASSSSAPAAVPASQPAAAASKKASQPSQSAVTPPPTQTTNDWAMVAAVLAILAALVGGAAFWPLPTAPQHAAPTLSAKAFKGKELRNYEGSALLLFTNNVTADKSCAPCVELDRVTRSAAFKEQLATWWDKQGVLRIGKVYCNQQRELCESLGVVSNDAEDDPGLPHLLWYKGGKEVGPYDGERTLVGFQQWVAAKLEAGSL